MPSGRFVWAAATSGLLMTAIAAGWLARGARPVSRFETSLGETETLRAGARVGFEWTTWTVSGSEVTARLQVEGIRGGTPGLVVAKLTAPGFRVSPEGEQVSPLAETVRFEWTVSAGTAGAATWNPVLSLRSVKETDESGQLRLLWSRSFPVRVLAPLGLDAGDLASLSLVAAGMTVAAGWAWRQST